MGLATNVTTFFLNYEIDQNFEKEATILKDGHYIIVGKNAVVV